MKNNKNQMVECGIKLARALIYDIGFPFGDKDKAHAGCRYHYTSDLWRLARIPTSIAFRILKDWHKRGWYDYGQSVQTGWLTDKGRRALITIIKHNS